MDIIYNIFTVIFLLIFGYLVGSIPNGIWIGKLFFHKDIREYGSGNSGGTNAGRVLGKKIGALVIFLDGIKVIFCLYIAWLLTTKLHLYHGTSLVATVEETYLGSDIDHVIKYPVYWITALSCSVGHVYPIFAHFKGGKNVASFYGLIWGASWLVGLVPVIAFFIILKICKYVSLSSVISAWIGVLTAWIWAILLMTGAISGTWSWFASFGKSLDCNYFYAIAVTLSAALLTVKHKANFVRLKNGNESKITWMK